MARKTPEVNSSSTADMAFLLLCFFMMTTTMDQDKGLQRRLPPMPDPNHKQENQEINKRNIIVVKINSQDNILVGTKQYRYCSTEIRKDIKDFIRNQYNDPSLPEKKTLVKTYNNDNLTFQVSKGVVSLQNDRGTSYETYLQVQNELVAAFNELRDEVSKETFKGKLFSELDEEQQDIIKEVVPQMISEAEPRDISKK
jgi:biopolymer transport protein ExbD